MKSVILSDLDLTLTRVSLMRALIGHHIEKRMIPARALKEGLAIRARYDRGELSYGESSLKSLIIWAGYLAGQNYDRLVADARDFFDSNSGIFYPYFSELRAAYRDTHDFYLVTANFNFLSQAVCDVFSLDGYVATELQFEAGICSRMIKESLLDPGRKGIEAQKILSRYDISRSIGLGDTENDAVMLQKVACPVCVNPSPELRVRARQNGWIIAEPEEVLAVFGDSLPFAKINI